MKFITLIALVILTLCLCGCDHSNKVSQSASTQSHVPVLQTPERPQTQKLDNGDVAAYDALPAQTRAKLESNDTAVKRYAEKLEATVCAYNTYAGIHNQAADAGYTPSVAAPEHMPSLKAGEK